MTEKRFKKFRKIPVVVEAYQTDEEILLNELYEENQRLKSDKTNLHRTMSEDRVRYSQFRDKVFCCIDKKIDEFKNGDYGDLPCNTIHMFLDLKEEIGDFE